MCSGSVLGQTAVAALMLAIAASDPNGIGALINGVTAAIANSDVPIPLPGGGTTSGRGEYQREIDEIADELLRINRNLRQLEGARAIATSIAAACFAQVVAIVSEHISSASPIDPDFCRAPDLPIFIVGDDAREAAQHDFDAIFGNPANDMPARPQWALLNYASSRVKRDAGQRRGWYGNDPECKGKTFVGSGLECDEYPYFSTEQGGAPQPNGPAPIKPSLRAINADHNGIEGRALGRFVTSQCDLQSATGITSTSNGSGGDRYLVLPTPQVSFSSLFSYFKPPIPAVSPVTIGLCNRRDEGGPSDS